MKKTGKRGAPEPQPGLTRNHLKSYLIAGTVGCLLLLEGIHLYVQKPATEDESSSKSEVASEKEKAPPSDAVLAEQIRVLNFEFAKNFGLVGIYMRGGGAQELYRRLHTDDAEKGGYISIQGSKAEFHFVENPDAKVFEKLRDAIKNDRPIPDPEKTYQLVFEHSKGIEKQDESLQAEKLMKGYKIYSALQVMQRNEEQERFYQNYKPLLMGFADTLRQRGYRGGFLMQNPGYVLRWHHHPLSSEPMPPSVPDKDNTKIIGPEIVLEIRDKSLIMHGVVLGKVAHSYTYQGLSD